MVIKKTSLKRVNIGRTGIGTVLVREAMRFVVAFCLVTVLLIGCGSGSLDNPKVREKIWTEEAVDIDLLQRYDTSSGERIYYAPRQTKPYTGWVKGEKSFGALLVQFQNGKRHGIFIAWDPDSQNVTRKGSFRNGELDGLWTEWYDNGQKEREYTYKDGQEDGVLTEWYDNGQKKREQTYKNGRADGVWAEWDETGKKLSSETYKDGKKVE